jgi:O-antigen/teichoic acid export membrane protein
MSQGRADAGWQGAPLLAEGSTHMKHAGTLFHDAAVYSLSNILNAVIPFLLLPVLTRMLPPSGYGAISMFNATLGVVGAFTGLSVHGAVSVRFVDRDLIDFPRYVGSCMCILLISTLVTLAVITGFRDPISAFASLPPFWVLMAVLVSFGNFLVQIRLGIWQMDSRPTSYGLFQVSLSAVNMLLSLGLVFWFRQGYEGRLWGITLATALFAACGLVSLFWADWVRFYPSVSYMKEALAFGVPLIPHTVGIFLIGLADRFIINQRLGLEQAGLYMVAVQLGLALSVATDAFNKAFVPVLYNLLKHDSHAARLTLVRNTWLYFLIALAVAAAVAGLSYWIIDLVAGGKYTGAAGALIWLALGQAFAGMYLMVTNYIFYARKTRPLAFVTLFAGLLGVTLTWFLIPVLGISGAGLSFAVSMLVRFLLTWALAQRVCPMPWFSFAAGKGSP